MSKILLNIPDDLQEKLSVHRKDIGEQLRLEAAFSMCSRGVLSTSMAARLAGLSYTEFLEAAAREKVELFPVDFAEFEEEALRGYTLGRQRLASHPVGKNGAA